MKYGTISCRTALSPSKLPGLKYSLNPYFGCEHGCLYCYSPSIFRRENIARSWGVFAEGKNNIPEVLARELQHKEKGTVGVSTVTDPYQPLESRLQLTRKCLEILGKHDFNVSIQTKSSLVLRDLDLVSGPKFEVGVTITTMDSTLARKMEPRASPPDARREILERCYEKNVQTWIFLGPIIPYLNDDTENMKQIIKIAKTTNSRILFDKLNLRPWVMENLSPLLTKETPESLENLPLLLNANSHYWRKTKATIESLCQDAGVRSEPAFPEILRRRATET